MKIHAGAVAALVLALGTMSRAEALAPSPGIAGCLDRAQKTMEAEHKACVDAGRNQMISGCSGAAGAALSACLALKHPASCIAANVIGLMVCAGAFWAAWEETQACILAADARYHEKVYQCQTTFQGTATQDPMAVRQCPGYQEAEQSHIPG